MMNKNIKKLRNIRIILLVLEILISVAFLTCSIFLTIKITGSNRPFYFFLITLAITTIGSMLLISITCLTSTMFNYVISKRIADIRYMNLKVGKFVIDRKEELTNIRIKKFHLKQERLALYKQKKIDFKSNRKNKLTK